MRSMDGVEDVVAFSFDFSICIGKYCMRDVVIGTSYVGYIRPPFEV